MIVGVVNVLSCYCVIGGGGSNTGLNSYRLGVIGLVKYHRL